MEEEIVKFNGKKITKQQLKEKIEAAKDQPGIKIQEVKPGVYKQKIEG